MTAATPNPPRLAHLTGKEDPHQVAELFQSAIAAPIEELPRVRWRIRATHRQQATRFRRVLRVALVTCVVFLTGSVVGAVLGPYWMKRNSAPRITAATPTAEPTKRRAGHGRDITHAAEPAPSLPEPTATPSLPSQGAAPPSSPPVSTLPIRRRLAHHPTHVPQPAPMPTTEVTAKTPPVPTEEEVLGDALDLLRTRHDPAAALALLDAHRAGLKNRGLAPEADMLRVEALLGLGRKEDALGVLDSLPILNLPKRDERLVLRGELRAASGRWKDALTDFDHALMDVATTGDRSHHRDAHERALWGRASAKSRLGDDAGARADLESYLRHFPAGRFAAQAARLVPSGP